MGYDGSSGRLLNDEGGGCSSCMLLSRAINYYNLMKKFILPLVALAIGVLAGSCKNDKAIDLKLALQPGTQYLYTMDSKTVMEQSAMGQKMKTEQNMIMESTYDVAAGSTPDAQRITVMYKRIVSSIKNPMLNVNYDSNDPSTADSTNPMAKMVNKPFVMEVTSQGEVIKLEGLSAIINAVGDSTTLEGAEARRQMAQSFSDTAIKSMMQQSLNIFPDHPVKPGDTWKKSYTMSIGPMAMKIDNEFKLTSVTGNTAHIDVNAKITGGGGGDEAEAENMSITLSGDQKGTMEVEVGTGLVTDSKLKQTITGDMSMQGMKIPMSISSDIHMSAKKK
jgi:hypothetical protein